jgi:hypothetical protein
MVTQGDLGEVEWNGNADADADADEQKVVSTTAALLHLIQAVMPQGLVGR